MLLRLLAPRLFAIMLPRLLAILLWLQFISPRVPNDCNMRRCHGQQPVHAKPSRCLLRLEPVAIEEAMTTDVSKRGYQMVLL